MYWRSLSQFLLLFYVFMIPVYYHRAKARWAELGNPPDEDQVRVCCLVSVVWPLGVAAEVAVEVREYLEWKAANRKGRDAR